MSKAAKWLVSGIRLILTKIKLGRRLELPKSGKPLYMGRGARICVAENARVVLGPGVYLSDNVLLQANKGAELVLGERVFLNSNARIVSEKLITIGDHTLLGPNVCIFDHDHVFDLEGVHPDLVTAPVAIGSHCWLGANVLVTRGVQIADRILLGGGSVAVRPLLEPGVYVGSPAHLVRRVSALD